MSVDHLDPDQLPEEPRPQLSPVRVIVALLVIAALGASGYFGFHKVREQQATRVALAHSPGTWFAPYVDVTLTPTSDFQDRTANPARNVVLGFVVAGRDDKDACTPTWGAYHTLGQAAATLDLDRRVAQVRGQGGSTIVSFGGQANSELAVTCTKSAELRAAYRSVIDRYSAGTVDFDVEGAAIADRAANVRRAKAIASLQHDVRGRGGRLDVWLTVPVTPDGLDATAVALVRTTIANGVDLAGVNIMAMDFGTRGASRDMLGAVRSAATATHRQLGALLGSTNPAQLWRRLGLTVMIGQNDVGEERLSVKDADRIRRMANAKGLGRVSIWSLNRDAPCGTTFAVVGLRSNTCSGVTQKPLEFTRVLTTLRGPVRATPTGETAASALATTTGAAKDDPDHSPYPIWQPEQAYTQGYKVVWRHAVYIAKWYTVGTTPDTLDAAGAASPWRLVGPVLRTDRAAKPQRVAAGTHPSWSAARVYTAGDKVLYHGLPYQARWYTQGDVPGAPGASGSPSPWKPLYRIPGEPVG